MQTTTQSFIIHPTSPSKPSYKQPTYKQIASTTQTNNPTKLNLFGLGAPEIAVIVIAGAFLLGPQKLAEMGKDAGKITGEFKEVPKEFQKGFKEGESLSKANRAKIMDKVDDE